MQGIGDGCLHGAHRILCHPAQICLVAFHGLGGKPDLIPDLLIVVLLGLNGWAQIHYYGSVVVQNRCAGFILFLQLLQRFLGKDLICKLIFLVLYGLKPSGAQHEISRMLIDRFGRHAESMPLVFIFFLFAVDFHRCIPLIQHIGCFSLTPLFVKITVLTLLKHEILIVVSGSGYLNAIQSLILMRLLICLAELFLLGNFRRHKLRIIMHLVKFHHLIGNVLIPDDLCDGPV